MSQKVRHDAVTLAPLGCEAGVRATLSQAPDASEPSAELLHDRGAEHLTCGLQE